jgi:N-acetylglutamate synthase-like GNAT family acetyltransferase
MQLIAQHAASADFSLIENFNVREATASDAEEIVSLVNRVIKKADYFKKEDNLRTTLEEVKSYLEEDQQKAIYVLKGRIQPISDQEAIIATIAIEKLSEKSAYLSMFVVDPQFQGKKIGRKLLDEVEKVAKNQSVKQLKLEIAAVHANLVRYYQSCGYAITNSNSFSDPEWYKQNISAAYQNKIIFYEMQKKL